MLDTWQAAAARRKEYVAVKLEYELEIRADQFELEDIGMDGVNLAKKYRKHRTTAARSASDVQWIQLLCVMIAGGSSRASNALAKKLADRLRTAKKKAKKDRTTVKELEGLVHKLLYPNPMHAPPKLPMDMRSKSLSQCCFMLDP